MNRGLKVCLSLDFQISFDNLRQSRVTIEITLRNHSNFVTEIEFHFHNSRASCVSLAFKSATPVEVKIEKPYSKIFQKVNIPKEFKNAREDTLIIRNFDFFFQSNSQMLAANAKSILC